MRRAAPVCLLTGVFIFGCLKGGEPAEIATEKNARPAGPNGRRLLQASEPRRSFRKGRHCLTHSRDRRYRIRICVPPPEGKINTQVRVSVTRLPHGAEIYAANIDRFSFTSPDEIVPDLVGDRLYFAWISENRERKIPSAIHLRRVDLKKRSVTFDGIVYSQSWGPVRLALRLHPESGLLLFAYNDFSQRNSKYLNFAVLDEKALDTGDARLRPRQIHLHDSSEKRNPRFCVDGRRIFLYHTTGDTYGLLAYRGKAGVAVSEISADGALLDYRLIKHRRPIKNQIRITRGLVYFVERRQGGTGAVSVKQILYNDLYNDSTHTAGR